MYEAKFGDTPIAFAYTMMKLKGKKEPKYSMKAEIVSRRKGISVNGVTKSLGLNFLRGGGSLDLIVKFAIAKSPRNRKATDRIAQPKPIRTTRRFTMIGRATPPRLEPAVTMPKAMARCRRNQVPTAARAIQDIVSSGVRALDWLCI